MCASSGPIRNLSGGRSEAAPVERVLPGAALFLADKRKAAGGTSVGIRTQERDAAMHACWGLTGIALASDAGGKWPGRCVDRRRLGRDKSRPTWL
jgi:hypothetical protein